MFIQVSFPRPSNLQTFSSTLTNLAGEFSKTTISFLVESMKSFALPYYKRTAHLYLYHTRSCAAIKSFPSTSPLRTHFSRQIWRGGKEQCLRRKFSRRCKVVPGVRGGVQISFLKGGCVRFGKGRGCSYLAFLDISKT